MINLQTVFSPAAMKDAWLKVKAKKKSGGIDNVTISDFETSLERNLEMLFSEIVTGKYIPEPYRLFFIEKQNKPAKEYRPLALMTVKDKIAQNCVYNYFEKEFEKKFIDTSYAYRPMKGHPKAIGRVSDFLNRKNGFVANLDIDNFFDTIDRKVLFAASREWFGDETILKLLEMWVLTGFVHYGKYIKSDRGIAQGGVLSPVLSNIYLHPLDAHLKERKISNVRYADNIVVFGRSEEETRGFRETVVEFLDKELNLKLNTVVKDVVPVSEGFSFCGIHFKDGKRTISPEKFDSIMKKHTMTIQQFQLKEALFKLRESVEGLHRYYVPYDTEDQISLIIQNLIKQIAAKIYRLKQNKETKDAAEIYPFLKKYSEIMKGDTGNRIFIRDLQSAVSFLELEGGEIFDQPPLPKKGEKKEVSQKPATGDENSRDEKKVVPDEVKESEKGEPAALPGKDATAKEAERLVERKRKVYYNKFVESLDLLISGNYAHVGKSGGKITVKREGKILKEVFANKLSSLIISAHGTTISADAVRLCIENKVMVHYFDDLGKPYAMIFAIASGANSISTAQAFASKGEKGKVLVKQLVHGKIANQMALLKFSTKNKRLNPEQKQLVDRSLREMEDLAEKVKNSSTKEDAGKFRSKIFGYEGSAAVSYWNVLKVLIPEEYDFKSREHQNAVNIVNQMLNYGYGILYSKILAASVLSGLNPNIPFLHSETKGKPSLTFDLIEPFRPVVVDRTILSIISRSGFLKTTGSKLSEDVRHQVSLKVIQRLYSELVYKGTKMTLNDVIIQNSKQIAGYLTDTVDSFKPYLMKW